ncbi:hypothetical protein [Streptomyces sp. NPDC020681]|uniref:hypothetical protein n=1 Tax=Streptomyces sp. NPDC020681 TaxID=3365083 RepID=UPI0037B4A10D
MAQWLADRLDCVVLAPDGTLLPAAGGALFVSPGQGLGWLRHQPGRTALPDSRRFPKPQWEYSIPDEATPFGVHGIAEPIPGGMWLRSNDTESGERRQQLIDKVIADSELLAVVLGTPGAPPLPLEAVSVFWQSLAPSMRLRVRFIPYGPVDVSGDGALGQALADLLAHQVVLYSGLPAVGRAGGTLEVHTLREDGPLGWRPFASELAYSPVTSADEGPYPPVPLGCRDPVPGLSEVGPGVYRYAPDAVLEIVQSGLYLRPPQDPEDADLVRIAPADPRHATIVFDDSTPETAERMRTLSHKVLEHLDPAARRLSLVLPAGAAPRGGVKPEGSYDRPTGVPSASDREATWRSSFPDLTSGRPDSTDAVAPAASPGQAGVPGRLEAPWAEHARRPDEANAQAAMDRGAAPDPEAGNAAPLVPHPPATTSTSAAISDDADEGEGRPSVPRAETIEPMGTPHTPAMRATPSASAPRPIMGLESEPPPRAAMAPGVAAPSPDTSPPTALTAASIPVTGAASSDGLGSPPGGEARDRSASAVAATHEVNGEVVGTQPEPQLEPTVSGTNSDRQGANGIQPSLPTPGEDIPVPGTPDPGGEEPVLERHGVRVQPTPEPAVCAVPPESGIDQERAWLRGSLGERYDAAAGLVSRVLSESPGLRVGGGASGARDDLVAVRVYLTGAAGPVDDPVRRGIDGPHVPLARCVASGLNRLPSYRGATVLRAALDEEERAWYREGMVVTDWGFCGALTTARPRLPGNTDFLIWSRTARRTALMDPEVRDRVLFLPSTRFKVLRVSGGVRPRILLRELAPAEITVDGRLAAGHSPLDDVALSGLESAAAAVQKAQGRAPLPKAYGWAFSAPPGLIASSGPHGSARTDASDEAGSQPEADDGKP